MIQLRPLSCVVVVCIAYLACISAQEELRRLRRAGGASSQYLSTQYKPTRDKLGEDCNIAPYYDTFLAFQCNWYLKKPKPEAIACRSFCNAWYDNMKGPLNLDDECKLHNFYGIAHCNNTVSGPRGCQKCLNRESETFSNCCGTCYALCPPGAGGRSL